MMKSDELREQGIAALKARRVDEARKLLAQALKLNPRDAEAWAYMGVLSGDLQARLGAFRRALDLDPANKTALTSLKALGIDPQSLPSGAPPPAPAATPKPAPPPSPAPEPKRSTMESDFDSLFGDEDDINPESAAALFGVKPPEAAKPPAPKPPAPVAATPAASAAPVQPTPEEPASQGLRPPKLDQNFVGVPLPPESYLAQAGEVAAQRVAAAPRPVAAGVTWARKAKNRLGENDVWQLRLQTGAAVLAFLLVAGFFVVALIRSPEAQRLVGIRTNTPSRTPTSSPTPTPGVTPTPTATLDATQLAEATPLLPTPDGLTPQARIDRTPAPTALFAANVFNLEGAMPRAIGTLNAGDPAAALPTFDAEVTLVSLSFNPYPYVFKAQAQAQTGDYDAAIDTLTEALGRTEADTRAEQRPFATALLEATYAEVELLRAQSLRRNGRAVLANRSYEVAIERAEQALTQNSQIASAYRVLAQAALDQRRVEDALDILETAFSAEVNATAFDTDVTLIALYGQAYLAEAATLGGAAADDALARADTQGRIAAFVNPYDRRGHELQIAVALAQGRAGDAVLLNDTYRLYFPDDPRALKLLGDARVAEGNPELAFNAYSDAATAAITSTGGVGSAGAEALVARADLLLSQGEYGAALADLEAAYAAFPDDLTRTRRMTAAYAAGEYELALEDARALIGSEAAPDDLYYLMQARIRYDLASRESGEALAGVAPEVLSLLERVGAALPNDQRAIAEAYRARAALITGNFELAETSVGIAYALAPAPDLLIVRADVRSALGRFDEARRDYLDALDQTGDTDESLALLARAGLETIPVRVTATAQAAQTATAAFALEVTATAQFEQTATAEAVQTVTAAFEQTETATAQPSPTPTATATP
jgi:tetratricopeptide (TPR) repeat protein